MHQAQVVLGQQQRWQQQRLQQRRQQVVVVLVLVGSYCRSMMTTFLMRLRATGRQKLRQS
jgi:hypothetical protein